LREKTASIRAHAIRRGALHFVLRLILAVFAGHTNKRRGRHSGGA